MIEERILRAIGEACEKEGVHTGKMELTHPTDFSHGDFASSVALAGAKQAGVSPRELAEKLVSGLGTVEGVARVEIAGPGYINFFLSREYFAHSVADVIAREETWGCVDLLKGKKVMVEYTQPNPFKSFHIGHLMTNTIGEAVSRLVEAAGADVMRVNYQGDVGLHVAKALWGLRAHGLSPDKVDDLGRAYALGNAAYEENEEAKKEITEINKKVYAHDSAIADAYDRGRAASLAHFEELYAILGTRFDHYFFESQTAPVGHALVKEGEEKGMFEKSDGAVVFRGEQHGLHTRVFVTRDGLPTYEAKDLGLALLKKETWPFDLSITTSASEQKEYFKVVWKALTLLHPEFENRLLCVTHGMMQFADGKMSSRKGKVVTGESLIEDVTVLAREVVREREFSEEEKEVVAQAVAVAAIKFSILRQSSGKDIIFDAKKSLSFEGDSGPYLQYALTRALSVLERAKAHDKQGSVAFPTEEVSGVERMLYRFPHAVERAVVSWEPHHVVTYLTELAAAFNGWYATTQILDETKYSDYKIAVTRAFAATMRRGLWMCGIPVPSKM